MIIDAHNHPNWHGYGIDKTVANMDKFGIQVTWMHTWEAAFPHEAGGAPENYADPRTLSYIDPIPLSGVVEACRLYSDRFVPFYAPHPKRPNPVERLKMAIGILGVRGVGEWKFRVPFDDPDCIEVFRFAGENGMPVTLHMDIPWMPTADGGARFVGAWYGGTVENLARMLEAAPSTTFLGHGPGFWRYIASDGDTSPEGYPSAKMTGKGRLWDLLEKYDNLYGDMSAGSGHNSLVRQPDGGEEFLTTFSSKVLFARDYFDERLQLHLDALSLPEDVRTAVMSGNALRLVPL